MLERHELFLETAIRDRDEWVRRFAAERRLLRAAAPGRWRARSAREWLGLWLIQAGRGLLRHRPAYAPARRPLG